MRFIGNKTQLLDNIKEVVDRHASGSEIFCDIFSGTASVARYFKQWYTVYSNDILYFSYCLQRGTVEISKKPDFSALQNSLGICNPVLYFNTIDTPQMEVLEQDRRFFQNNYSPNGDRMYMTDSNALRVDYARNTVEDWFNKKYINDDEYYYLVACIIEGIPFISNIAGTYGAFSKKWDARSNKTFELIDLPVINNGKDNRCFNCDGAELLSKIKGDILYIDPPYNERQYLPNYHVLETAAKYDFPELRGVTGQRAYENQRSDFCSKKTVYGAFESLIESAKFTHIILSYNTDGIMELSEIERIMKTYGNPESFEVNYIPYRRFKSHRASSHEEDLKEMLIYIRKDL